MSNLLGKLFCALFALGVVLICVALHACMSSAITPPAQADPPPPVDMAVAPRVRLIPQVYRGAGASTPSLYFRDTQRGDICVLAPIGVSLTNYICLPPALVGRELSDSWQYARLTLEDE